MHTTLSNLLQTRAVAARLAERTGYPKFRLALCYIQTLCRTRATTHEFEVLRLYEFPIYVRNQFLSYHRCIKVSNRLIADASPEELACIGEKQRFNTVFGKYVRRDWLYVPDSTPDEIRAFLDRNDVFLAKKNLGTQGKNIFLYRTEELDRDAFLREYGGKPFVLEAFIRQHPAMAELNPSSVNTVRLVTAHCNGSTLLVGAGLRIGGAGAFVDNFHHGGLAFPLDREEGYVNGPGFNYESQRTVRHPATGRLIPGFAIPFWPEIVRMTMEAATVLPRVGYIGWDVAVTEDGPEFVEANVDIPGPTVIQMDRPDAYGRLQHFFEECGRLHG